MNPVSGWFTFTTFTGLRNTAAGLVMRQIGASSQSDGNSSQQALTSPLMRVPMLGSPQGPNFLMPSTSRRTRLTK